MIFYEALFHASRRPVRRDFMVENSVFACFPEVGLRVADHAPAYRVSVRMDGNMGTCHP
jgi:hypothetical protein